MFRNFYNIVNRFFLAKLRFSYLEDFFRITDFILKY